MSLADTIPEAQSPLLPYADEWRSLMYAGARIDRAALERIEPWQRSSSMRIASIGLSMLSE